MRTVQCQVGGIKPTKREHQGSSSINGANGAMSLAEILATRYLIGGNNKSTTCVSMLLEVMREGKG